MPKSLEMSRSSIRRRDLGRQALAGWSNAAITAVPFHSCTSRSCAKKKHTAVRAVSERNLTARSGSSLPTRILLFWNSLHGLALPGNPLTTGHPLMLRDVEWNMSSHHLLAWCSEPYCTHTVRLESVTLCNIFGWPRMFDASSQMSHRCNILVVLTPEWHLSNRLTAKKNSIWLCVILKPKFFH